MEKIAADSAILDGHRLKTDKCRGVSEVRDSFSTTHAHKAYVPIKGSCIWGIRPVAKLKQLTLFRLSLVDGQIVKHTSQSIGLVINMALGDTDIIGPTEFAHLDQSEGV